MLKALYEMTNFFHGKCNECGKKFTDFSKEEEKSCDLES